MRPVQILAFLLLHGCSRDRAPQERMTVADGRAGASVGETFIIRASNGHIVFRKAVVVGAQSADQVTYCGALTLDEQLRQWGAQIMHLEQAVLFDGVHFRRRVLRFIGQGLVGDVDEGSTYVGERAGCTDLHIRLQGLARPHGKPHPWRLPAPQADDPTRCSAVPATAEERANLLINPCPFSSYGRFPPETPESLAPMRPEAP